MFASLLYLALLRLLTLGAPSYRSDDAAQIEILVLRHELGALRRQVKRPVYRSRDRALLAAASRILPRERWGAFLVRPETLLRWHRSLVARKWTRPHRPPGRPAIDPEVRRLILSMARENPRWGYLRIKGELGKLGVRVSATSIAMLLRRSGVGPAPRRGIGWRGFLKAQAAGILACDFFTVETAFLKTLYVLFFIEIGTRRVHVTVSTTNPDSSFVTQQARNLVMSLADLLILGPRHLDRILRIYAQHYNRRRPHRGLKLRVPESIPPIEEADGVPAIERRDLLGGLLHEYIRAA
jgi:putative transposase